MEMTASTSSLNSSSSLGFPDLDDADSGGAGEMRDARPSWFNWSHARATHDATRLLGAPLLHGYEYEASEETSGETARVVSVEDLEVL